MIETYLQTDNFETALPLALTDETLAQGLHVLSERDADLANILSELGPPPLWPRPPGFPTLVHIILEQQVSLASAKAAYERLLAVASPLTPERFLLLLDDATLRSVGFSRQKAAYCRNLAATIVERRLDVDSLATLEDDAVRFELTRLKGIGRWSADIYLLMALRRPDIWPSGDLGLVVGVQRVKRRSHRPTPDEVERLGESYRPWRAVATRLFWHYYLSKRAS